jgi:hypothetical protein
MGFGTAKSGQATFASVQRKPMGSIIQGDHIKAERLSFASLPKVVDFRFVSRAPVCTQ